MSRISARIAPILLALALSAGAADQWFGFDWQEAGLTQSEFQAVKASNLSREKVIHLLEIGVRPGLYLQRPWEQLGVSEEHWLAERGAGMDDSDIDRTLDRAHSGRTDAAISLALPSFYQWKTRQTWKAAAINLWTGAFLGSAVWLTVEGDSDALWLYLGALAANFYSFVDGMADNPVYAEPDEELAIAPVAAPGSLGVVAFLRF